MERSRQVAAIPVRRLASGAIEVLLVTSRETQRWVIPKGWPMPDRTAGQAAAIEAWEEAGVRGRAEEPQVGTFTYDKRKPKAVVPVTVEVFRLDVTEIAENWPEKAERARAWFSPREAAERVQEPELKELLLTLA